MFRLADFLPRVASRKLFFPSDVNPAAAGEISGSPLKIVNRKIEGRTPTVGHIAEVRLRGELPSKHNE